MSSVHGAQDVPHRRLADRRFSDLTHGLYPFMAESCYVSGMTRVRVSTTVDGDLLDRVRRLDTDKNDATLLDEALAALLRRHRRDEIDAKYEAYERLPLDTPDDWGNLESWLDADK